MKVQAVARYTKISPSKVRPFAKKLRGLSADKALDLTEFNPGKAAMLIGKTLKSAIANVKNNNELAPEGFHVDSVIIEEGPGMRRYWSRARGMARPIKKRTSHIRVVLSDE